jgi:TatD DNase family protein
LAALDLARRYDHMKCTLGLHPTDVGNVGHRGKEHRYSGYESYVPQAENLEALMDFFRGLFVQHGAHIVGFGETGFDLFHAQSPALLALQERAFLAHIQLAEQFDRALVIHSRSARQPTLDFLERFMPRGVRGVWHCFCEDLEAAKIATEEHGLFLGIGGIATYKNAASLRAVIREIPLEFLVTETDAPFLVPDGARKRGTRVNESRFLTEVVGLIAELKDMDLEACAEVLVENGKRLFCLEL